MEIACLVAERVMNTMVLGLWSYVKYLGRIFLWNDIIQ